MQIEFTKEQYKNLLKLVYCWDMMINWVRLHDDRIVKIDNLCSHIFSKAKDFWCEDLVDYDEENNMYYWGRELDEDEEVSDYIDTYDNNSEAFWDNLIEMLVERDLSENNPLLKINKKTIDKLYNLYWEEFVENWIKNLRIAPNMKK